MSSKQRVQIKETGIAVHEIMHEMIENRCNSGGISGTENAKNTRKQAFSGRTSCVDIEEVVGSSPISSTMTHCRDSLILGSAFFISCDQVDRLLEPQLSSLAVRESVKLDKHF